MVATKGNYFVQRLTQQNVKAEPLNQKMIAPKVPERRTRRQSRRMSTYGHDPSVFIPRDKYRVMFSNLNTRAFSSLFDNFLKLHLTRYKLFNGEKVVSKLIPCWYFSEEPCKKSVNCSTTKQCQALQVQVAKQHVH